MRWKRRDWEADREGGRSRKRTGGKWAGMEKGSGESEGGGSRKRQARVVQEGTLDVRSNAAFVIKQTGSFYVAHTINPMIWTLHRQVITGY